MSEQFNKAHLSYNYCGICGHVPKDSKRDEPNRAPLRWWDPDDGWKIGALCRGCHDEFGDIKPQPGDYAFEQTDPKEQP